MRQERLHVDNHAHADKKIGDEQGIAHKLQMNHQRRRGRNEAVEHDAHQEGPENALDTHKLHEARTQKDEGQHENKLGHGVVVAAEKPAAQARKRIDDDQAQGHHLEQEPEPVEPRDVLLEHAAHHGQHEQHERVGHDGAAHGDAHAAPPRQAVAQHDGIGHERVRGVHGCHQHRGRHAATQHPIVGSKAQKHRQSERQQAHREGPAAYLLDVLHVHLKAGQKHDVVEPHLAEELKTGVAREQVRGVGPYQHAGPDHAHHRRYAQALQEHRSEQDDAEHDEENPRGIRDGKILRKLVHRLRREKAGRNEPLRLC